jgi:hypothetical protein
MTGSDEDAIMNREREWEVAKRTEACSWRPASTIVSGGTKKSREKDGGQLEVYMGDKGSNR